VRRAFAFALLFAAANAFAAEKWLENYNKGVEAVNARRYAEAAPLLAKAIAERPTEGTELKVSMTVVAAYTPHFWLGIARFNLGDVDAALREWRVSEEQGAIARTAYYSRMKDWVARAQTEKQLQAEKAASGAKKAADAAIRRAVESQGDALSAGGDRTEAYRDAQRKLQDALARFRQAGTNSAVFDSVAQTAEQAAQSFTDAAEEGKRIKAAAANRPKPQPVPVQPKPVEFSVPFEGDPKPALPPQKTETVAPAPIVEKPGGGQAIVPIPVPIAVAKPTTPAPEPAGRIAGPPPKVDVTPAYRAFATGDLAMAERLLDRMLDTTPAAEAFLLRGCVRYTRAMLSRTPDALLLAATDDFRAALDRNRALRLDRRVFSPKLVERFEQVRSGR
jgi:tetratricopeptide (TPR) repeat protein